LRQAVADKPDAFLTEYAEQFGCTATAVCYALAKLGITRKKAFTYYEKSEERRAAYTAEIKRVPQRKRVYGDASGVHTSLRRENAHVPQGATEEDLTRGNHFERVNIVGRAM
jgi:hypothetical protein